MKFFDTFYIKSKQNFKDNENLLKVGFAPNDAEHKQIFLGTHNYRRTFLFSTSKVETLQKAWIKIGGL